MLTGGKEKVANFSTLFKCATVKLCVEDTVAVKRLCVVQELLWCSFIRLKSAQYVHNGDENKGGFLILGELYKTSEKW